MTMTSKLHYKARLTIMSYCVGTKHQGSFLKPILTWDGKDKTFDSVICGWSGSDYVENHKIAEVFQGQSVLRRIFNYV